MKHTHNQIQRLLNYDCCFDRVHGEIVKRLLEQKLIVKALDVGCGAGGFTKHLAAAVSSKGVIIALDADKEHLQATRRIVGENANVIACVGDVKSLQFLRGEFDFVWCSRVIHHHLPNPLPALTEIYRVLKPGGRIAVRESGGRRFYFSLSNYEITKDFLDRLQDSQDQWFQSKFGHRRPKDDEWQELLEKVGFKNVRRLEIDFIAPAKKEQTAHVFDWLVGFLVNHDDPERGNLLTADDANRLREMVDSADSAFVSALNDNDLKIETQTAVYLADK